MKHSENPISVQFKDVHWKKKPRYQFLRNPYFKTQARLLFLVDDYQGMSKILAFKDSIISVLPKIFTLAPPDVAKIKQLILGTAVPLL